MRTLTLALMFAVLSVSSVALEQDEITDYTYVVSDGYSCPWSPFGYYESHFGTVAGKTIAEHLTQQILEGKAFAGSMGSVVCQRDDVYVICVSKVEK